MRTLQRFARSSARLLALAAAAVAVSAPAAHADGMDVWRDCVLDGAVNGAFTPGDFRDALANPPADADEYTNCRGIISRAQTRALGGAGSSDSGSATTGSPGGFVGSPFRGSSDGDGPGVNAEEFAYELKRSGAEGDVPASGDEQAAVGGQRVNLAAAGAPTIESTLALPLPLTGAAIVVLLSALLPLARAGSRLLGPRSL